MIAFLMQVLTDVVTLPGLMLGFKILPAAEALEKTAVNPKARPYQIMAFCLFLVAAMLLLSAALADWFDGRNAAHDHLGWAGFIALNLCVFCGLRYGYLNRRPDSQVPQQSGPAGRRQN
jgi:hypothetical protein